MVTALPLPGGQVRDRLAQRLGAVEVIGRWQVASADTGWSCSGQSASSVSGARRRSAR